MATEEQNPRQSGLGIGNWLRQPENRAGLLQASLSMLTQGGSGGILPAIGQAVGEGAEARDRSLKYSAQQQEQELDNSIKTRKLDNEDRRLDLVEGRRAGGGGTSFSNMMRQNNAFQKFLQVQAKAKAAENFTDDDTELAGIMNDPVALSQYRQQFNNVFGGGGEVAPTAAAPAASATPSEGTIIRNPTTGERQILRGGKWEKM